MQALIEIQTPDSNKEPDDKDTTALALTLSSGIPPVTRVGKFESGLRWGRATRN
jgi:hypothetical protein